MVHFHLPDNMWAPTSFLPPITPANSCNNMQSKILSPSYIIRKSTTRQLWNRTSTLSKTTSSPHPRVRLSILPRSGMLDLPQVKSLLTTMSFTMGRSTQHQYRQAKLGFGHTSLSTSQTWVVSSLPSSELLAFSWGDTKVLSKTGPWFTVSIEPQTTTGDKLTQSKTSCSRHLPSRATEITSRAKSSLPPTTFPIWSITLYALTAAVCSAAAASLYSAGVASTSTRSSN